jgi:hypothetical protein
MKNCKEKFARLCDALEAATTWPFLDPKSLHAYNYMFEQVGFKEDFWLSFCGVHG